MLDRLRLAHEDQVPSPALLIYPDRVEENLRQMVRLARGPDRLRPHIKTHKLPQIVALKRALGIRKFKAATIAEAEMCARAEAPDVLLAYPVVGPNVRRLVGLVQAYPLCRFSCLADDATAAAAIGSAAAAAGVEIGVFVDLDIGTLRTGVPPGPQAASLYRLIGRTRGLRAAGLHVFDGHLKVPTGGDFAGEIAAAYAPVWRLRDALAGEGLAVPAIVAGGTPTFPILAQRNDVELGAGTCVLWDQSYAESCPGLDFQHAALVLTRVISRPAAHLLCLDLGHKAIASEMPHPRVRLLGLDDATFVRHNEEHLVVSTSRAADFPVGSVLYGIPRHVCPTVALHDRAFVVRHGQADETWPIVARARILSL